MTKSRPILISVRQILICAALVLPVVVASSSLSAQTRNGETGTRTSAESPFGARDTADRAQRNSERPLLDRPISRTEYRVGPGDVLAISLVGNVNDLFTAIVAPDGAVLIPSVGAIPVLGLNLNDTERRISAAIARLYQRVQVSVTLAEVRVFKIFLVGDVASPGVQIASAVTRVSEVVPGLDEDSVVRRNVVIRRASGDSLQVDLASFRFAGDLSANPVLQEGDAVIVPQIDQIVNVYGEVAFPGPLEYRPGESLAELLQTVTGPGGFSVRAADTIRISRFVDAKRRQYFSLPAREAIGNAGQAFLLEPFDAVFIAGTANYKEQQTATANGQVQRPGRYPIEPGVTTVRELVELAGGFTEEASLATMSLRRGHSLVEEAVRRRLERIPPEVLSERDRQVLQILSNGGSTNVVGDFEALFITHDAAWNVTLQAGDSLVVPRRRAGVTVLGAVVQPGIVQHSSVLSLRDFIQFAGGYTDQASRRDVVVLKARDGNRIPSRQVRSIDPGDVIVVPFAEPWTWQDLLQTTSLLVTTVAGLVLSFGAIF